MKKATLTLILVLLITLSFTAIQTNEHTARPILTQDSVEALKDTLNNREDSLEINDKNIEKEESIELSNEGLVSWYGKKFHGRYTSSGEKYDMNDLTAAHKTLPFGTKVKIRNPENGKEVIVRITDRGPFAPKREFDLSKAAFEELTSLDSGLLNVVYEVL